MLKTKNVDIKKEIIAGVTTFCTMMYIVIVNPTMLSTPGTGMSFSGVLTGTVLLCFLMTLLMGVYANLPFAVGPGMGINAFFTYTILLRGQIPWPIGLGIVFWSGVLFLLCSLTPVRTQIAAAIPENIRYAVATGMGIFLTFIGLRNAKLVVSDPVTFVKLGTLDQTAGFVFLGLIFMVILLRRKNPFAFLGGIALVTGLSYWAGQVHLPQRWLSHPDFDSTFLKLDIWGAFQLAFLPAIVSIFFTDLFDSISTFVGCSYSAGLKDRKGQPLHMKEGLIVDAWATLSAGVLGTSAGTAYVESAAGIEAGGRTGWTSVVTAFCFLPCLFLAPLVQVIPSYATAPVLILVGGMMFRNVTELKLSYFEDLVPAFLTIVLIPLTFSITQGLLWGLIAHVTLFILSGRRKEIKPMMYGLFSLSIFLLLIENFHR